MSILGCVFRDAAGVAEEIGFVDDRYDTYCSLTMYFVVATYYANSDIRLHGCRNRGVHIGKFPKGSYKELLY